MSSIYQLAKTHPTSEVLKERNKAMAPLIVGAIFLALGLIFAAVVGGLAYKWQVPTNMMAYQMIKPALFVLCGGTGVSAGLYMLFHKRSEEEVKKLTGEET